MKPSSVALRELYRPLSNWSLKVKHAGAFCQRQLAAAACETALLYGLTTVRTSTKFRVTRWRSAGDYAEVFSVNVGTCETNFWLILTAIDNEYCCATVLHARWQLKCICRVQWPINCVSNTQIYMPNSIEIPYKKANIKSTRLLIIFTPFISSHSINASLWNYKCDNEEDVHVKWQQLK